MRIGVTSDSHGSEIKLRAAADVLRTTANSTAVPKSLTILPVSLSVHALNVRSLRCDFAKKQANFNSKEATE